MLLLLYIFCSNKNNQIFTNNFILGDFAILINSGMTIKQAIGYNLVSAVLAYFGLVVGILIGEYEIGRHFILSITAGLFLYVALADMVSNT